MSKDRENFTEEKNLEKISFDYFRFLLKKLFALQFEKFLKRDSGT